MDGLTHASFPFLAGKFFKRSREECAALLLGGIAPDFDIFISWIPVFFQTSIPLYHRGITHTFLFGFVTAAIVLFIASRKYFQDLLARAFRTNIRLTMRPSLLVFAYIGVLSHFFLDGLTAYGIAVIYPLSTERYSAELFYYIDFSLMFVSLALLLYAIVKRGKMVMSIHKERKTNHSLNKPHTLQDSSAEMNVHYKRMFIMLLLAIALLSGLRYYEKTVSSNYFNISISSIYPSAVSPFEWQVVDQNAEKRYEFDSLRQSILYERNFTGTNPNIFKHNVSY